MTNVDPNPTESNTGSDPAGEATSGEATPGGTPAGSNSATANAGASTTGAVSHATSAPTRTSPNAQPAQTDAEQRPAWGQHLQIVFSVLVGVSFAQAFSTLGTSRFSPDQLLLIGTVFYVVLDCWYNLNLELVQLDVKHGWDIALYLLALLCYSCLPFLYFAHTANTNTFGPAEFLTANLCAICCFDAIRRTLAFVRSSRKPNIPTPEQEREGKNAFLMLTGYAYGVALFLVTLLFSGSDISTRVRAEIILGAWLAVRTIDNIAISRLSLRFFKAIEKDDPGTAGAEGS
ncbi:MAG TPA: hypothetical protein VID29_04745 [Solirubrobacteraceae bacterium]|jgi:hypothetical protein